MKYLQQRRRLLPTLTAGVMMLGVGGLTLLAMTQPAKADAINNTDFVMTIDTTKPGVSNTDQFTIPVTGGGYNYTVDCNNDGIPDAVGVTSSHTCTYSDEGRHTIRIGGTFPQIYVNNAGDRLKIMSVDQWGTGAWRSMDSAFRGAENMDVKATDVPNLTNVTSLQGMFDTAHSLKGEGANWQWNTSNVTTTANMFHGAGQFNQNIGAWNMGNVTSAGHMFAYAGAFNNGGSSSIASWNTAKLEYADSMFEWADSFNQPIGLWNMTKAHAMVRMLANARAFNQSLAGWQLTSLQDVTGNPYAGGANMLDNTALSVQNYDATLTAWNNAVLKSPVTLGAAGLKYCTAEAAHAALQKAVADGGHGWTINGDAKQCPTYALTFDTGSGSPVPSQTVAYTAKAVRPADPTRAGYTFAGWYADPTYLMQWDFNVHTMPNSNFTLYAKWNAVPTAPGNPGAPNQPGQPSQPGQPGASQGRAGSQLADTGTSLLVAIGAGVAAIISGAVLLMRKKRS